MERTVAERLRGPFRFAVLAVFVAALFVVACAGRTAHASTAAFAGTVEEVSEGAPKDKGTLRRFTVRFNYIDYISTGGYGKHTKAGETITRRVMPLGTVCILNGRLTNAPTFAAAIRPGTWGYFYEDTWLDMFTTPDFVWGEVVGHESAKRQFSLKVHFTHKDIHLDANPPKVVAVKYDAATAFRNEESDSSAEQALAVGHWVQVHQPRPQIITARTPKAAFTSKQLLPYKQGRRGYANDLTAPAVVIGYKASDKYLRAVTDVPVEIHVYRLLGGKSREVALRCRKTTFILDGKPCPVAVAARPGRHAVLGHYRSDEYPHKVFVSSISHQIRGTFKSVAADGNSMVVALRDQKGKTTDKTVSVTGGAQFWLDGRESPKADVLKKGLEVVVYPKRGRTIIAFGENEPTMTAEEQAIAAIIKNPPAEPPPESMIEPLIDFMCKAETEEAYQAAALLARIGPPAIRPLMAVLENDRKPSSWRAVWALGKMGSAAKPAVADLTDVLRRTKDAKLREMITEALGSIR